MKGKSCAVVLIGNATAGRKWITYEIKKVWVDHKGVVGIYIHNLKNLLGQQSTMGTNPFSYLTLDGEKMSTIIKAYNPPYTISTNVYDHIKVNIES